MSSSSEKEFWLDRWWQPLVILFGIIFVSILVTFKPVL
jgi:hypothetical protein